VVVRVPRLHGGFGVLVAIFIGVIMVMMVGR
jgi:hypothetical protein